MLKRFNCGNQTVCLLCTIMIAMTLSGCGSGTAKPAVSDTANRIKSDPITVASAPVQTKKLEWKDRRPIGMIMLSSTSGHFVEGNRQWRLMGSESFNKAALLRHADSSIKNLSRINAQGMITWDIEGQEFPHPYSYIGDPRRLPKEMEPVADAYFKKFRDAGFKVGVCVRPDSLNYSKGWPEHFVAFDRYKILEEKIQYAYKRWGCRLFYIDSNIGEGQPAGTNNSIGAGGPIDPNIFKRLFARFPDCLIIPEAYNQDYLDYVAPLNRHNGPHVLKKGFQVLDIADNRWNDWQIEECLQSGGILMGRVWYKSPELDQIIKFYKKKDGRK